MADRNNTRQRELRFLEAIGIRRVRNGILAFERFRHRKDGKQNQNYHPQTTDLHTLKSFTGYLLYNALLHGISLLFIALYFTVCHFSAVHFVPAHLVMGFLVIFNLYCILLQRYSYLRLSRLIQKVEQKRKRLLHSRVAAYKTALCSLPPEYLASGLALVTRLRNAMLTGSLCRLCPADLPALERLPARSADAGNAQPLSDAPLLPRLPVAPESRLQTRVSRLQKLFRVPPQQNVCYRFCVSTQTPELEQAFQKSFPAADRGDMELTIEALFLAYQQVIATGKGAQQNG